MTEQQAVLQLDRVCRGCLIEECDMTPIFQTDVKLNIAEAFEVCTSLRVSENDGYPSKVCAKCMVRLNDWFQFRQMCIQSNLTLRSLRNPEDLEDDEEETTVMKDLNVKQSLTIHGSEQDKSHNECIERDKDKANYCKACSKTFDTAKDLKQHEFDLHMPNKACSICNTAFTSVEEVMNHLCKHLQKFKQINEKVCFVKYTEAKKYQCKYCIKAYTSSNNLQIHMYSHTGVKPFVCKECGKSFTKLNALNSHLSLHTGYMSFLCSECGKGYSTATGLKRHKLSHSGEKPYKCQSCPGSFSTSGDLTVHMRCHTGEKPYLCPTCGKSFSRISHLHTHARIHTGEKPYKCSRCGKAFAQSGDLRSHERTHTGEKPYSCAVCKKRFVQSSGLTSHMKTHTGEKSYRCTVCSKAFSQASSLSRHLRGHTD